MISYFNPASYARAKRNNDDLVKTNPQQPVLKDEDEKFLERVTSSDDAAKVSEDAETTKITDAGEEKVVSATDDADEAVVPEAQPEAPVSPETAEKKKKKDNGFELPSQEDAETMTRGWNDQVKLDEKGDRGDTSGEKRTWASYLPTIKSTKKDASEGATGQKQDTSDKNDKNDKNESDGKDPEEQRTWAEYASSYVPSVPTSWKMSKDKDSEPEPVYNEDGTINQEKTKEKQEKEVSVLLDNLNMSSINNRVFALSGETHKIYERFAQVLKDTINGGPTAYEDMEKLMREAGPQLEKQFQSMPPFVQTLVKSLPAKLGTTLAPEMLAAASEKPGNDLNARLKNASAGEKFVDPSTAAKPSSSATTPKQQKKRKIKGLKSLVGEKGAVAGILRSTVNFLQTRFPFLASTTNVVMSLAVFILMFVFWYCHKRGKEVRLASAAEAEKSADASEEGDDDDIDVEYTDEDDANADENANIAEGLAAEMEEKLNQPTPSQVPLPEDTPVEEKK